MRNYGGQTPLFMAVWYNYPEIVSILLKNGAKVDFTDNNGRTPIKIAQEEKFFEIEKRLKNEK
jgi:ankyrin repeat protein